MKVELFSGCALAYFTAGSCLAASGLEKLRVREQRDKQVRADSEAQGRQLGAVQELGTKHPAACLELSFDYLLLQIRKSHSCWSPKVLYALMNYVLSPRSNWLIKCISVFGRTEKPMVDKCCQEGSCDLERN